VIKQTEQLNLKGGLGIAGLSLLLSSTTLVCCVLPALLISVGAGAVLASLVSAFPALIWLSAHKGLVFGGAAAALLLAAVAVAHQRTLPCPLDPKLARACGRLRAISQTLLGLAIAAYAAGVLFAFVLPWWGS